MVISEKELTRCKEIEVFYGIDKIRRNKRVIQLERTLLSGIQKIVIDGFVLLFLNRRGKEKARLVLKIGECLEIDKEFGIYKIIGCK